VLAAELRLKCVAAAGATVTAACGEAGAKRVGGGDAAAAAVFSVALNVCTPASPVLKVKSAGSRAAAFCAPQADRARVAGHNVAGVVEGG